MSEHNGHRKGYKKTKLGWIPEDWEENLLGNLIEICSSKRVLQKDWKKEGIPFLRTREIINLSNREEFTSPIFINEALFIKLKSKYGVPKSGDILATGVGTIGQLYIVKETDKFYFKDGNVIWFKMNNRLDSNFLMQLFKTRLIRKQLSDNATITTVATFTIDGARKTKIIYPIIKEQQKIAHILSTADKEIENLEQLIATKESHKKGLQQQLFNQTLRFKDENGNDYPDWEEKRLGEVCKSIKSGRDKSSNDGIIPLYGSTGKIGKCSESSHQGEFILIARVGANAGLINLIDGNFGVSDNTLVVDCKPILDSRYVYYFLDYYNLNRLIFGSGQPLITATLLKALKLYLPKIQEQKKIARVLSTADKEIENLKAQLEQLKLQKQGLMQKLLTGEVRVKLD